MSAKKPCLAIFLIPGCDVNYAASYHWCQLNEHDDDVHQCYCGILWSAIPEDLVEPTPEMRLWRSGDEESVRAVSGRMLG